MCFLIPMTVYESLGTIIVGGAQSSPEIVVFIILVSVFFWTLYRFRKSALRLPPGPFALPVIGNLHHLGELPHQCLQRLRHKYGPLMLLRLGSIPTLVVSSSDMAKEFLKTHDLVFANRPHFAAAKYLGYDTKSFGFAQYGPYWRYMRKLCLVELLSSTRLETFRAVREEEVSLAMRFIWDGSQRGTVPLNLAATLLNLFSGLFWRILSGTRYSSDEVNKDGELKEMMREAANVAGAFNFGDLFPRLAWVDVVTGTRRRMKQTHHFFDVLVEKIIDKHVERRQSSRHEEKERTKDLVDVMLDLEMNDDSGDVKIEREHIKAVVFDMFLAGVESTATALEWAMSEMLRNPRVGKKLQEEIKSVVGKDRFVRESDLAKMEYLQCVVKETLRLHPPGPLSVPHESREACTIGGYDVPEKTRVLFNVWAIGRDPAVWEDPLGFKPERFVGKNTDVQGRDLKMIPFGGGRRSCPGAEMALGSMELALAQLMHCFEWRIEGEGDPSQLDMTESFKTSLHRKHDLFAIPMLKLHGCTLFAG